MNSFSLKHIKRESLKVIIQKELVVICMDDGDLDQCQSAILILSSVFSSNNKSLFFLVETLTENNFDIYNPRIDCILLFFIQKIYLISFNQFLIL